MGGASSCEEFQSRDNLDVRWGISRARQVRGCTEPMRCTWAWTPNLHKLCALLVWHVPKVHARPVYNKQNLTFETRCSMSKILPRSTIAFHFGSDDGQILSLWPFQLFWECVLVRAIKALKEIKRNKQLKIPTSRFSIFEDFHQNRGPSLPFLAVMRVRWSGYKKIFVFLHSRGTVWAGLTGQTARKNRPTSAQLFEPFHQADSHFLPQWIASAIHWMESPKVAIPP